MAGQKIKIKLCGLTRPEDILAVNPLRPNYIGLVFAPRSRRCLTPEQGAELSRLLDGGIKAVGVFVDAPPQLVADLLNRQVIRLAQLHGQEDEAYIRRLRELLMQPEGKLIQAFQVREAADISRARQSSADYLLLDSGAGSGRVFDWRLLGAMERPYFLAGGLTPDNVGLALGQLAACPPYGVDVSSGVETAGRKDPAKLREFVRRVRDL